RSGNQESACFDAIWNDLMCRPLQFRNALDDYGRCTCSFDLGTHTVEHSGEVNDFRFPSSVTEHSPALSESGGHHQVLGSCDGNFVECDFGAMQMFGRCFNVPMAGLDRRTEFLESSDMQIDRTSANRAATGKGHPSTPCSCEKRPEREN